MRGRRNASGGSASTDPGERKPRHKRPDPRPSRLVVGAGAVAALSIIGAGLVRFPVNADGADASQGAVAAPAKVKSKAATRRPVKYVRLKPGQKAPRGAKVIQKKAPPPRIVVIRSGTAPVTSSGSGTSRRPGATRQGPRSPVARSPVARAPVIKAPVTRTRQSG
jgi:hypothetical protein